MNEEVAQEEMYFAMFPELNISSLIFEELEDNETFVIKGFE